MDYPMVRLTQTPDAVLEQERYAPKVGMGGYASRRGEFVACDRRVVSQAKLVGLVDVQLRKDLPGQTQPDGDGFEDGKLGLVADLEEGREGGLEAVTHPWRWPYVAI